MSETEQTYGEKAVGLTFNHAEGELHDEVHEVKTTFAKLIDLVEGKRTPNDDRFKNTLISTTVSTLVSAQMFVVKVITWKAIEIKK